LVSFEIDMEGLVENATTRDEEKQKQKARQLELSALLYRSISLEYDTEMGSREHDQLCAELITQYKDIAESIKKVKSFQ
jgi:hypothetical protein